ncbi:MAG: hypothetical protein P1U85_08565 [Verrucomicrobiales bacterium]|nr:hypothetical protein [Verrucomicrobiales bacterium]
MSNSLEESDKNQLPSIERLLTERPKWGFMSNHTHVLVCLYLDPEMRLSEISFRVGLTLRIVQKIIKELADEKVIAIEKIGRRNHYRINLEYRLRHPLVKQHTVGELLEVVTRTDN